ncbi:oxygenase MpaB family protein [Saccharomonospora sp. CUA-673]|uniref:oxygenase MpaB family protein n=1 Tax=Saccharomonospora sp. CUA-673 TaxID=1904969 RepID=UPI001300EC62|nr:oxygenase MpaB family protein [Saccharomonospora sp. CUA-673]
MSSESGPQAGAQERRQPLAEYWEDRTMSVADVRKLITELDPVDNDVEITHLSLEVVVPPMFAHAAFTGGTARGMIHPAEATVGYRKGTGDGIVRPHHRDNDTLAFFGLFMREGYRSDAAQAVFDRVQQIHHDVNGLHNDLQLHILGLLTFEPDRYVEGLGAPGFFTDREKYARYNFWKGVGTGMGITDIPGSYHEFQLWVEDFERRTFKPSKAAREIYRGQTRSFSRYFPGPTRILAPHVLTAGLSPMTKQAVDADPAWPGVHKALCAGMAAMRGTERFRKTNLSRTWVSQFSRLGENPDIHALGYQHDVTSDRRYQKAGPAEAGYRYTVARGLESAAQEESRA